MTCDEYDKDSIIEYYKERVLELETDLIITKRAYQMMSNMIDDYIHDRGVFAQISKNKATEEFKNE